MTLRSAVLILLACVSPLAACAPDKPWLMEETNLSPAPMRIVESRHIVKKPLSQVTQADLQEAARIYDRNGAGPMYLVVAYKEQGKGHMLDGKAGNIVSGLQSSGVNSKDIVSSIVPLETDQPVMLIAFDTLEARGPKGCTETPSLDRLPGTTEDYDYKLGCGVNNLMAKQIANPRDLNGVAGLGGSNDGERAANVVRTYRTGEANDFLPNYVISELSNSGGQ